MRRFAFACVACCCLIGCELPERRAQPLSAMGHGELVRAAIQRDSAPTVDDSEQSRLVDGNTAFACDLYRQARGDGNLCLSPHSISIAMAMVYAGARGKTAEQIRTALHYDLPTKRLHPAFNTLDRALTGSGDELRIVNGLWVQRDREFFDDYLDLLARHYGTGLRTADFMGDPDGARRAVNAWVAGETDSRIRELFKPGDITGDTCLVLADAVRFSGRWVRPFDPEMTHHAPFHTLAGRVVDVPMMARHGVHSYTAGDDWQAVELGYRDTSVTMLLLLPAEGALEGLEERLDPDLLQRIVADLKPETLGIMLPRFQLHAALSLEPALRALGVTDAFDEGAADFSGICDVGLWLEVVRHEARVEVDEQGTRAVAATGAALPECEAVVKLVFDHPFVFVIGDRGTGTVLFFGRVADPRA